MAFHRSGKGLGQSFLEGSHNPAHSSWLGVFSTPFDSYGYEARAWLHGIALRDGVVDILAICFAFLLFTR